MYRHVRFPVDHLIEGLRRGIRGNQPHSPDAKWRPACHGSIGCSSGKATLWASDRLILLLRRPTATTLRENRDSVKTTWLSCM